MKDGFLKVAAVTPIVRTADCHFNAKQIVDAVEQLPKGTALAAFPELCITGATCGDLFFQIALQRDAENALDYILRKTAELETIVIVGVPVSVGGKLYSCAAVCQKGQLLGVVPKTLVSNHSPLMQSRHFSSGKGLSKTILLANREVLFADEIVFSCRTISDFCFGIEFGEELLSTAPISGKLCEAGATVMVCLSAENEVVAGSHVRRRSVVEQSLRSISAYIFANAGEGESVTDLVFAGHNFIAESGAILKESASFSTGATVTEIDLQKIVSERRQSSFWNVCECATVSFDVAAIQTDLSRAFDPYPFIPADKNMANAQCEETLCIQAAGLAGRLRHTGCKAVLGLSGGLDSALALLVSLRAYAILGRDTQDVLSVTMPCFGTTGRTYRNACDLATTCGTALQEISISDSVRAHFTDIGHDGTPDITYENAQARERTQVLMDLANAQNGIVVGTGDLSELALGWATYNGDHMSMYSVNASIPKTLVRYLVEYEANRYGGEIGKILRDILDTPVSPELLPVKDDTIVQKTESIVGDYALHDFFLYYTLRFGFAPAKIYRMACLAFSGAFDLQEIKKRLILFEKRFFSQQFKRNCMPDGPKVSAVSLSPRGAWQMPSDAIASAWVREAELL